MAPKAAAAAAIIMCANDLPRSSALPPSLSPSPYLILSVAQMGNDGKGFSELGQIGAPVQSSASTFLPGSCQAGSNVVQ